MSQHSVFKTDGMKTVLELARAEIQELYLCDDVPWIIGYSGGKDSTAVLQLTWQAIAELPEEERKKPIYVISTDTMVENPIVASWVNHSLEVMRAAADQQKMPVVPKHLTPALEDSFWVNLIGKGYPAPRHKFRWCTERLKIKPSNSFINGTIKQNGEVILLLGSRSQESANRARMLKDIKKDARDGLRESKSQPNCFVYTPIENWSNDDVWLFLMQVKNPWGYSNKDLLGMYSGATADGECPLVVDTDTPSCGDSRFGCWVCTLVEKDKSMTAMIQNDGEKEWMQPLLELRNELDFRGYGEDGDRHLRDFRRLNTGNVQMMHNGNYVPGPYTQEARERWVQKLLEAQAWIRRNGPEEVSDIVLITLDELKEIRRIWVIDKHEMEDSLPQIFEKCTGEKFPTDLVDDNMVLGREELKILREICGEEDLHYQLTRELISTERQQRTQVRRSNLYEKMEASFKRSFFDDKADAISNAKARTNAKEAATQGKMPVFSEAVQKEGESK